MVDIMRPLAAKRMGTTLDEIDLLPHKKAKTGAVAEQKPAQQQTKKQAVANNPRTRGPCFFGCVETYRNARGTEDWRKNPANSPWEGMPQGTVLCAKCYWRARDMIKRCISRKAITNSLASAHQPVQANNMVADGAEQMNDAGEDAEQLNVVAGDHPRDVNTDVDNNAAPGAEYTDEQMW